MNDLHQKLDEQIAATATNDKLSPCNTNVTVSNLQYIEGRGPSFLGLYHMGLVLTSSEVMIVSGKKRLPYVFLMTWYFLWLFIAPFAIILLPLALLLLGFGLWDITYNRRKRNAAWAAFLRRDIDALRTNHIACIRYSFDKVKYVHFDQVHRRLYVSRRGFAGSGFYIKCSEGNASACKAFVTCLKSKIPNHTPLNSASSQAAVNVDSTLPYRTQTPMRQSLPPTAITDKHDSSIKEVEQAHHQVQVEVAQTAFQQTALVELKQRQSKRLQRWRTLRLILGFPLALFGGFVCIVAVAVFFSAPSPGTSQDEQKTAAFVIGTIFGLIPLLGGIMLLWALKSIKLTSVDEQRDFKDKSPSECEKLRSRTPPFRSV